jgi:pSer/pThr/pTyr-binding forkhead associated (FHA) protein
VPPVVITVLKILLLVLLYFFVYRAVRTIAGDLYGGGAPREQARPAERRPRRPKGGTPGRLVVLDEQGTKVATHRLGGTLVIGRDPSVEVRLDDTYASQQHARISERNGAWLVEDLGSTNGTYLNRRKVTVPSQLAPGDRIRIGNTYIEVRK